MVRVKSAKVFLVLMAMVILGFLANELMAADSDISFYLPFDGNTTAKIAKGDKKPVDGDISEFVDGIKGKAAITNIENWVKYEAQDNISAKEGTITLWMKIIDWDPSDSFFHFFFEATRFEATKGEELGWLLIYKFWNTNQLRFLCGISGKTGESALAFMDFSSWKQGEWHFVACTWSPGKLGLYVDGKEKKISPIKEELYPKDFSNILIGGHRKWKEGGEEKKTAIDELYIYNRALSSAEIESIYIKQSTAAKTVEGKIGYFPYINSMGVEIVMQSEKTPELKFLVNDSQGKNILEKVFRKDDFRIKETNFFILRKVIELPALKDATYSTLLETPDKKRFLERNFEVKHYEWEHNTLGKSDAIIPPFTPLKVEGNKVESILRKHYLGNLCLWEQVESLGEPILAEPISLKVKKDGKIVPWIEQKPPQIIEVKPNIVRAISSAKNNFISVEADAEFDYDGLMKVNLKIIPLKNEPIDRIWLEIPVKEKFATLFHAVGEKLRANPGDEIPKKKGLIFESRSIPQPHIENFIPYVWVGEEQRGICWAADWDKDWIHSKNRSAIELFREKNKIVIIVNFINGPVTLNRERNLQFALQASPVKPLPSDWREMTFDFQTPGRMRFPLLWSASWGAHYGWASRYPLDCDFSLIHKLNETKKTGKIDSEFVEKWIKKVMEYPGPISSRDSETQVRAHVNTAFNCAKGLFQREPAGKLLYYSCATFYPIVNDNLDLLPENKIYKDDWEYDEDMSAPFSFQDYAIWYADKMMSAGMDGIYVDNTYLEARTCWPIGEGYIGDDGLIHPSLGLWRIRSLIRRLAIMMYEKGREPFVFVHMTIQVSAANIIFRPGETRMGIEIWKFTLPGAPYAGLCARS